MRHDLDTRARAAADGLRRAAGALDVPEWDGEPSRRRPGSRVVWLTAAAAVVLVVIVATLLVRDDKQPVVTTPDEVPVLIPDVVPEGAIPTGGTDFPLEQRSGTDDSMSLVVFGDPNATDPFASDDLGVTVRFSQAEPEGTGREPLVRGQPSWVGSDGFGRTVLGWSEVEGVYATVASASLNEQELRTVAEGLSFSDGYTAIDATVLPDGLAPVASLLDGSLSSFLLPAALPETTVGHAVGYQSAEHAFLVSTMLGGPNELLVIRWQLGGALEPTEVRGSQGYSGPKLGDEFPLGVLLWEESPGTLVVISGDLDHDEILAVAESLRPATSEEWGAIQAIESGEEADEATSETASSVAPSEVIARGTSANGSTWELILEGAELCHSVDGRSASARVCSTQESPGAGSPDLTPLFNGSPATPIFIFGLVAGGTAVEVVMPDGEAIGGEVIDGRFYVVELSEAVEPVEVVFLDAAGVEIGRVPVR